MHVIMTTFSIEYQLVYLPMKLQDVDEDFLSFHDEILSLERIMLYRYVSVKSRKIYVIAITTPSSNNNNQYDDHFNNNN